MAASTAAACFDAAHAFGCSYNNTKIGNFGSCETFSFHATKVFNTFEGGAITTNDDTLAEKVRLIQNFGFSGKGHDDVVHVGTNGKMSEVSAAMGVVNLTEFDCFVEINKRNYDLYKEAIEPINGLELIEYNDQDDNNWHYVIVEVERSYPMSRDGLIDKLWAQNVRARRYFWPGCHRMEPYRSLQPNANLLLPVTEDVSSRIVALPTGTAVDEANIARIINLLAQ